MSFTAHWSTEYVHHDGCVQCLLLYIDTERRWQSSWTVDEYPRQEDYRISETTIMKLPMVEREKLYRLELSKKTCDGELLYISKQPDISRGVLCLFSWLVWRGNVLKCVRVCLWMVLCNASNTNSVISMIALLSCYKSQSTSWMPDQRYAILW